LGNQLNLGQLSPEDIRQFQRSGTPVPGFGVIDFDVGLQPIDALRMVMVPIVAQLIVDPHSNEQSPGHAQRQPNNIDQTRGAILEKCPKGKV
jgi:hypothetical protein